MTTVAEPIKTKKLKTEVLPVQESTNVPAVIDPKDTPTQGEMFLEGTEKTKDEVIRLRKSVVNGLGKIAESLFLLKQRSNWKKDPEAAGCNNIDDYFRKNFGYSAVHAGRMLSYYEIEQSIEDPELRPENEGQARLLKSVPVELRAEVMEKAKELAPKDPKRPKQPGKLSAAVIEAAKEMIVPIDPNAVVTDGRKAGNNRKQEPTQVPGTVDTTIEDENDPSNTQFSAEELKAITILVSIVPSKHYPGVYVFNEKLSDGFPGFMYYRLKLDVFKKLNDALIARQPKPEKPKAADVVLPSQADPTPEQIQIEAERASDAAELESDPLAVS